MCSPWAVTSKCGTPKERNLDNQVVRKLLTGYPQVFQKAFQLGRDVALTLRLPNPRVERDMRKSMVEALQSIPSAWDMAQSFYGEETISPIQEVILPLTTSAEELSLVEAYYRKDGRRPGRPYAARRQVC